MQRIVHCDEPVDTDGNGFSAIGRLELNQFLDELCRSAGVRTNYEHIVDSLAQVKNCDLLVGAESANSFVRRAQEGEFATRIAWLTNRFAWYGTAQRFECLSLTFRANHDGHFVAHHYRHSPMMSTFVVECDESTWRRAGLDLKSDDESRAYCEQLIRH